MKRFGMAVILGILVVSMASFALAGADGGYLSGTVVDAEAGLPVEGALVFVRICMGGDGGVQGTHIYSDTTDADGAFYIADLPAGEWEAIAKKRGVGRDEETILIEVGYETVVSFELAPTGGNLMLQIREHQNEE